VQQITAQADAILVEDQPAFEAAIEFFRQYGANGLERLLAQRNEIETLVAQRDNLERACTLVIHLPDELKNKPAALHDYYHAFNSAFDQLYISARVTGSGLFSMNSRAAEHVNRAKSAANGLQTMVSYLPDALQKMAVALPFPASAVAAVMASAWIYQRDNQVFNSLNAFAELMVPHISEHNLIGKQLATNICLQQEAQLLALAAQSTAHLRFVGISANLDKIKGFAQKHHLTRTDFWQSPMQLKALEDLNQLQKGVLKTSVESTADYLALARAQTAHKTDFLLKLLGLQPANIARPPLSQLKPAPLAGGSSGVSPQDLRKLETKLSQAEQKLDSVATVAQNAKLTATAAERKASHVEQRFDLLAPESLHPVPVAAGRQMYLAAQVSTSQHAVPTWLSGDRQQSNAEQQIAEALTDTALRFDNVHAENRELKQSLSEQEKRQAKLKNELEKTKVQASAQIQAQEQRTAELERQVQEMRALVARQAQVNTLPADGCCVIL
jgi:hypothetical protein